MKEALRPCPFCGGTATIVCCDDEGNIHGDDYGNDPWSGLGYQIRHSHEENEDCPIARYAEDGAIMGGVHIYDTREEAIEAWNRRESDERKDETMKVKMKPKACPFCGCDHIDIASLGDCWRALCVRCNASMRKKEQTDLISAWNRREKDGNS